MAHIEKRQRTSKDGKPGRAVWRARYRTPDGRERSRSFDRKVEAERWLATEQAKVVEGRWTDPAAGKITVRQWAAQYERQGMHRARTTIDRDNTVLRKWWLPRIGHLHLAALTPRHVRQVVEEMAAELAPKTVATDYGVFRALMTAAVEAELIGRSPCRGVKLPKITREPIRFLSLEELHRLADAMPSEYRAMVWLAGAVGLRWSEVAGLRLSRIDFLRRTVRIDHTIKESDGQLVIENDTKSPASKKLVPMPPFVVDQLAEHVTKHGPLERDDYLFRSPTGGPLRESGFRQRVWARAVRETDLGGLTFHGLRHTLAGLLIAQGAHPKVIQERMRHSSIRVTFDVYGHVLPALDDGVTDQLDEALRNSRGPSAAHGPENGESPANAPGSTRDFTGGGDGIRTHGLYVANVLRDEPATSEDADDDAVTRPFED